MQLDRLFSVGVCGEQSGIGTGVFFTYLRSPFSAPFHHLSIYVCLL